jgi:hypothetical protein
MSRALYFARFARDFDSGFATDITYYAAHEGRREEAP